MRVEVDLLWEAREARRSKLISACEMIDVHIQGTHMVVCQFVPSGE